MEKKRIDVAVIAAGARSRYVVGNLLRDSERNVHVAAVYDPDRSEMEYFCGQLGLPDTKRCSSAEEAIRCPGAAHSARRSAPIRRPPPAI